MSKREFFNTVKFRGTLATKSKFKKGYFYPYYEKVLISSLVSLILLTVANFFNFAFEVKSFLYNLMLVNYIVFMFLVVFMKDEFKVVNVELNSLSYSIDIPKKYSVRDIVVKEYAYNQYVNIYENDKIEGDNNEG